MIYFLQERATCAIKIGFTDDHPDIRRKQLQTGNSDELVLLAAIDGDKDDETEFHQRFKAAHIRGEWFRPEPELIAFMAEFCWQEGYSLGFKHGADHERYYSPDGQGGLDIIAARASFASRASWIEGSESSFRRHHQ